MARLSEPQPAFYRVLMGRMGAPDPDRDDTALADEQRFVANLRDALRLFLGPPVAALTPAGYPRPLDYFTWKSVFSRIEPIWRKLAGAQNA